eukprot:TRINITY_DN66000_c5_g1_i2.p1 TRINITY_DN66000_c5_g1~~TRINITY_DN66000_c5_g1_i2.p1  ORF type:complete len:317 (-),score=139.21 TRINITY_DN66000_c5_g1_i2:877-1827(-)
MTRVLVVAVVLLSAVAAAAAAAASPETGSLPPAMVAGLSAGGFMAVQYHVAFSGEVIGAGVIAGGPFYCAGDSAITAQTACMSMPSEIDTSSLVKAAKYCEQTDTCDALANLKTQKVWLWSGTSDTVVHQGVMKSLAQFYTDFMPSPSINETFTVPAEHSWPTNNWGNACGHLGSPYINNCDFDSSYAMTTEVFGPLSPPVTGKTANVRTISQDQFVPGGGSASSISMGPKAYVYYGGNCTADPSKCRAIVVFHGCQQSLKDIGTDFIAHIGMNEVAEANNLVVLYPQAIRSYYPVENPEGCWDWYVILHAVFCFC